MAKRTKREAGIIAEAIDCLVDHYGCLGDSSLAGELGSCVKVPNTGNRQADVDAVKEQIKSLVQPHEVRYLQAQERDLILGVFTKIYPEHTLAQVVYEHDEPWVTCTNCNTRWAVGTSNNRYDFEQTSDGDGCC